MQKNGMGTVFFINSYEASSKCSFTLVFRPHFEVGYRETAGSPRMRVCASGGTSDSVYRTELI